jgi:hypothetical protein
MNEEWRAVLRRAHEKPHWRRCPRPRLPFGLFFDSEWSVIQFLLKHYERETAHVHLLFERGELVLSLVMLAAARARPQLCRELVTERGVRVHPEISLDYSSVHAVWSATGSWLAFADRPWEPAMDAMYGESKYDVTLDKFLELPGACVMAPSDVIPQPLWLLAASRQVTLARVRRMMELGASPLMPMGTPSVIDLMKTRHQAECVMARYALLQRARDTWNPTHGVPPPSRSMGRRFFAFMCANVRLGRPLQRDVVRLILQRACQMDEDPECPLMLPSPHATLVCLSANGCRTFRLYGRVILVESAPWVKDDRVSNELLVQRIDATKLSTGHLGERLCALSIFAQPVASGGVLAHGRGSGGRARHTAASGCAPLRDPLRNHQRHAILRFHHSWDFILGARLKNMAEAEARRARRSFSIAGKSAAELDAAWRARSTGNYCWCCIMRDALDGDAPVSLEAYQWVLDTLAPPRDTWNDANVVPHEWLIDSFLSKIVAVCKPLLWLVCTTPFLLGRALVAAARRARRGLCRRLYEHGARMPASTTPNMLFAIETTGTADVLADPVNMVVRAIENDHYRLLEVLMSHGAPVVIDGARDMDQPLWKLCFSHCGPTKVLRMLELGASPLLRDERGVLLADAMWTHHECTARDLIYYKPERALVDTSMFRAMLIHHACTHWTRRTHARYPRRFRERVFALLCTNRALGRGGLHRDTVDIVIRHMCANEEEELDVASMRDTLTRAYQCEQLIMHRILHKRGVVGTSVDDLLRSFVSQPPLFHELPPPGATLAMGLDDGTRRCARLTGTIVAVGLGWENHTRRVARGIDMQFVRYIVPEENKEDYANVMLFYVYLRDGSWRMHPHGHAEIRVEEPTAAAPSGRLSESETIPPLCLETPHFGFIRIRGRTGRGELRPRP